ncbi:DUF3375 domain-containing protein [Xanthomonas campestris]|uniref:DUF3375 domain-containing protein n=1 Tax=Xanthomonas campestris TaxID=339 RepID=UPI002B226E4B|nr:DUF3375 domain-containing protein [Xanthomonas campestris]MEA9771093.1 DUF3375 domain-containing protein [Xanthomonas campestris pv. raphani]MEA9799018.1 DUF3375 domain-containing protein [Xanthomonas campestris pv. raphani]MEA9833293.1 DUF3375 domain-containing protein [Xanthomonas campestris pv. raphani]MEA9923119.1 DUF3375 domain-containing protein [Xanthomonas campestris pv. raphani]MEA9950638.1 DUF3375 domain-containing protein [Xanthomonas campestris pv. raphani]
MKVARARIARYRSLREDPLWKLLAADHAPEVIGLLQALLLDGERQLPAAVLHERLQRLLDDINAEQLARDLPRTAQAYVAHWLAQGWLERRLPEGAQQEEYELSTQAAQAIRFVDGLEHSRGAATESRLALVMQQLTQLAALTETNPDARLSALRDERDRIDAEIARVSAGKVASLDGKRALERTRQVIALADELTEDFRRVRDDFEQLNRQFRERIIDDEGERGEVLTRLFEGVDVIGDSEAGRSFQAFWALLNDAEQSAQLDAALETVLARAFTRKLDRRERSFLRGLTGTMLERGGQVHDVMQHFARSLRGFVQSRGYLEQRRLNRLLKQAQAEALSLREHIPAQRLIGRSLMLTTSRLRSLSQWRLHDPRQQQVDGSIQRNEAAAISLDSVGDLVAQSEIDFRSLRCDLFELLATQPQLSIAQALTQRQATQGLGSVIGYLSLGTRHGVISGDQFEVAQWRGSDGQLRRARIPLIWFTQEKRHELA